MTQFSVPMPPYSSIRRGSRGRRRGQPSKKEKHALKVAVYERAGGLCELKLHRECSGARVLPFEGGCVRTGAHGPYQIERELHT
jgi:hypothetical protein